MVSTKRWYTAVRYGYGELGSASLYGGLGALPPVGTWSGAWVAKPSEAGAYFSGNGHVLHTYLPIRCTLQNCNHRR